MGVCLLCLFSIPAVAQEGRFGDNPKAVAADAKAQETPAPALPEKPADFSELRSQGLVLVDQVIDPLRIRLQDGRIIQLTGLEIPGLEASDPGDQATQTFEWLKKTVEKKQVTFYQTKHESEGRRNRMGHYLGHIETREDKIWIQGAYLLNGWAHVQPSPLHTEMATQMLNLQSRAMENKRGLWAEEKQAVLNPDNATEKMNSWAIVEGKIVKTAMSNNTVYLNFGDDWRKDFTIGVEPEIRRQLSKKQISAIDLQGRHIRVYGWIESYNGPFIKLSNAAWLEILPEKAPDAKLSPGN